MYIEPTKRDWITVSSSRLTLPPIRRTLSDYIFHVIFEEYGITREGLLSQSRVRVYSKPRQMAMYLLRNLTKRSYPSIGNQMKRDHTTVIHGVRAIEDRASKDRELSATIVDLECRALDLFSRD